ncbi:unnamed protein product [Cercopithifilaria johnstoni]|uniref:Purple acid phosphatase N-terminal domain-containing protein n=1 Tax=Cercopithifilaria johnstoni TaxID=2874296 RepID=A0A8J2M6E1_9BILA|nr:unnamed protein product [Cercopithifilaria johnstoni]
MLPQMLLLILLFASVSQISCEKNLLKPFRATDRKIIPSANQGPYYAQPEQIALTYGGNVSSMWITWLTYNDTFSSIVEYGIDDLRWSAKGNSVVFIDGGKQRSKRYIHRTLLVDLIPGTVYQYHVGSEYGWSSLYRFKAMQQLINHEYIYAIYGDLGVVNARSLGKIQQQAQRSLIDAVLHVGDMAYNLDTASFIFLLTTQKCFRLFHK